MSFLRLWHGQNMSSYGINTWWDELHSFTMISPLESEAAIPNWHKSKFYVTLGHVLPPPSSCDDLHQPPDHIISYNTKSRPLDTDPLLHPKRDSSNLYQMVSDYKKPRASWGLAKHRCAPPCPKMPFPILLSTQGGADVGGSWQHHSAPAENYAKPQLAHPGVTSETLCTEVKGKRICSFTLSKSHKSSGKRKQQTLELNARKCLIYCQNADENEAVDSKESRENDPFESNINKSLQWYRDDLMLMVISRLQLFFLVEFFFFTPRCCKVNYTITCVLQKNE